MRKNSDITRIFHLQLFVTRHEMSWACYGPLAWSVYMYNKNMCMCYTITFVPQWGNTLFCNGSQLTPDRMKYHFIYPTHSFLEGQSSLTLQYYYPILTKQPEMLLHSWQSSERLGPLTTSGGHWWYWTQGAPTRVSEATINCDNHFAWPSMVSMFAEPDTLPRAEI